MKTMKQIPTMLVALMAAMLSFTSCNTESDDYQALTPEQIQKCYLSVAGYYDGKVIFQKNLADGSTTIKADSLDVSWRIDTDSTLTIYHLPASSLCEFISNDQKELKEALTRATPQTLECLIGFVQLNPIGFLVNPKPITYDVEYGGQWHKVEFRFWINSYSSCGIYNTADRSLSMQVLMGAIFVDGEQKNSYLTESVVPLIFKNKI